MDNKEIIDKLERLKELSRFYDYGKEYKGHLKKIKKEIKRVRNDDK